jgi:adenylate cyclase
VSVEIERKFVLPGIPAEIEDAPAQPIQQGYLAITDGGIEVRLRRIGDATVLTVKQGAGERRLEEEVEIPTASFAALWPLTEGRRVEKRRYVVGGRIEVDVYAGRLEGLVVAEVEFESEQESAAFDAPTWLGREVTGDARYANQRLALEGMP